MITINNNNKNIKKKTNGFGQEEIIEILAIHLLYWDLFLIEYFEKLAYWLWISVSMCLTSYLCNKDDLHKKSIS